MAYSRHFNRHIVTLGAALMAAILCPPAYGASIVHRFDFENETGEDSVGGLEGVLVGDPLFDNDAPSGNRAIILDGTQYVRIDDEMDFGSQFSLAMWVLPDSTALGIQTLVANSPGGWDTDGFKLYYNTWSDPLTSDGAYILETGDGVDLGLVGDAVRSDADTIVEEEWTHVGATVNIDDGEVWFYVNGELLPTTGGLNFDMKTDSPFEIGRMLNDWELFGKMDDVQIYEGVLTDDEMRSLFENPGSAIGLDPSVPGDFNGNGQLDIEDIDELTGQSASGNNDPNFDLNNDNLVDEADINVWIKDLRVTWIGDANLDDEFGTADLVGVLASGTYETGVDAVWSTGDFNGDGRTNSGDLVAALADGGYEQGPRAALASVPEPASFVLALLSLGALTFRGRR